jgi:hypothetical protein
MKDTTANIEKHHKQTWVQPFLSMVNKEKDLKQPKDPSHQATFLFPQTIAG